MDDSRPLAERARPASIAEMVGNSAALAQLKQWAGTWAPGQSAPAVRGALLEGPAGVGKTTAALALAQDLRWTVVEMNASDARNRRSIEEVAGRASLTTALSSQGVFRRARAGGRTLLLLDEADCLTGRASNDSATRAPPVTLREFLRARYGRLDALSSTWGLGQPGAPPPFTEWEQIPAGAGRAAWSRLPAAQRDLADWHEAREVPDRSDRGGLGAIARLARETRQPLILTVNDAQPLLRYSPIFRTHLVRIRFHPARDLDVRTLLRRIVSTHDLLVHPPAIDRIVDRAQGDLRAAVNDLDAIAPLPIGPAQLAVLGGRDRTGDFFDFTRDVLTHPRFYRSVEVRDRLDATPDDLLPWFEENAPRLASDPGTRARALDQLGRGELFLSRARRYRVWSLWSYASELLTGGVATAVSERGAAGTVPIAFPQFLGAMGRTRAVRATRQALLGKIGRRLHLSRRKGIEEMLPFLEGLVTVPRTGAASVRPLESAELARELGLDADELALLLGVPPDAPEVSRSLAGRAESGPTPKSRRSARSQIRAARATPRARSPRSAPSPAPGSTPSRSPLPPSRRPPRKRRQRRLAEF